MTVWLIPVQITSWLKQMSSYCQGLKRFALFSWFRNHINAVQEGVQSSAVAYEQLQIAEFVKIWQMMFVTLAWQRSLIRADQGPGVAPCSTGGMGHSRPSLIFQCISLYGSQYNTTRTTCIHPDWGIWWSDAKKSRLLKAYTKTVT